MPLERYQEPMAPFDYDAGGQYVCSYAAELHLVEAHIFRKVDRVVVFVTKSPGVPVFDAERIAHEALRQ